MSSSIAGRDWCTIWSRDLDGEANEVKHAAALLQRIPASLPAAPTVATANASAAVAAPWLIVADRAFGIFQVCQNIVELGGHFMLRKHGMTQFVSDPERPARHSTDRFGRPVVEEWGWVVRGKETKTDMRAGVAVRQITVQRDAASFVALTSLLDAERYPADDLLDGYLARWNIENVFQQVTEVFHLRNLISSAPRGMLFQLVLTFLMYNVVQALKQTVAQEQQRDVQEISTATLFRDIQEELVSLKRVTGTSAVIDQIERIAAFPTATQVRERLRQLLTGCWCNRWQKANYRRRDPSKQVAAKPAKLRQRKSHDSVQRVLQRHNQ